MCAKEKDKKIDKKKKRDRMPKGVKNVILYFLILILFVTVSERLHLSNYFNKSNSIVLSISVGMMFASSLMLIIIFIGNALKSGFAKKIGTFFEFVKINVDYSLMFAIGLFLFIANSEIQGKENFGDLATSISTLSSIIESATQPFVIVTLMLAVIQKYNVWFDIKPKISESDVAIAIMQDDGSIENVKKNLEDLNIDIPIIHIKILGHLEESDMEDLKVAIAKSIKNAKSYSPSNVHLYIKGPIFIGTLFGAMASNNLNVIIYQWGTDKYLSYGKMPHNTAGAELGQNSFEVNVIKNPLMQNEKSISDTSFK